MATRALASVIGGQPASDGAGVRLARVIGQPALMQLDPFLLLDAFHSDDPNDYIAGFPPHPHRGFETVTYLLHGRMRHADNAGHEGVIEPGGIQWMTAGRGIVHAEMPQQEDGLLQGFQLWINLPASHKLAPPRYQEYSRDQIPLETRDSTHIRVIAGNTSRGTRGPVVQPLTEPLYLDITLAPGVTFAEPLEPAHSAFVYLVAGELLADDAAGDETVMRTGQLGILASGDEVRLRGGDAGARLLLVAGRPLGEPIARGGPFVMNTEAEVRQAFADYRAGNF
ncbi:MAG: pirin family protein [Gammaproteobacteria bacterium]|nr:pirin family protein [Gammaproteobacteria bacterium]